MSANCPACAGVAPLCAACRAQSYGWLKGTAGARGLVWGRQVAARAPGRVWPAWEASPRLRARALGLVADLGRGDAELLERLGRECAAVAGGEYTNPDPRPGSVAFTVADGILRGDRRR